MPKKMIISLHNRENLYNKDKIEKQNKELNFKGKEVCSLAKMNKLEHIQTLRYVILKHHLEYLDEHGFAAIHYACKNLNFRMVDYLLKKGTNPNLFTVAKLTPLDLLESMKIRRESKVKSKERVFEMAKMLISKVKQDLEETLNTDKKSHLIPGNLQ